MAVIRDPGERRLRALKMVELRVGKSASIQDIAEAFNVSTKTVERTLTWARKAGIIASAEDKALQELVPLAHEALKGALAKGDAEIALEIFKNLLPSFSKKNNAPGTQAGDELSSYLNNLRGADGHFVVDGELVDHSAERALPAAEAPDSPQGDGGTSA